LKNVTNNNKPNFVIAAFPSKEVIDFINHLKQKYKGHKYSSKIAFPIRLYDFPHLTIKRKFLLNSGISEMQLIKIINSIVKNFSPPKLATGKVKLFKKQNKNTVYLEIKSHPQLAMLVSEIQQVLEPISTTSKPELDANFIPHLTILWQISDQKLMQVKKIFREQIPTFKFRIGRLHLLRSIGNLEDKRNPVHIFKLKSAY